MVLRFRKIVLLVFVAFAVRQPCLWVVWSPLVVARCPQTFERSHPSTQ